MSGNVPDRRDLYRREYLGSDLTVISSPHPGYIGISGTVVDETQRTFRILTHTSEEEKVLPKSACTFRLAGHEIVGRHIMFRPEDRIKKIH